jgi:hypothetical protein
VIRRNVVIDVVSWGRLICITPVLLAIGGWYLARGDLMKAGARRWRHTKKNAAHVACALSAKREPKG